MIRGPYTQHPPYKDPQERLAVLTAGRAMPPGFSAFYRHVSHVPSIYTCPSAQAAPGWGAVSVQPLTAAPLPGSTSALASLKLPHSDSLSCGHL